MEKIIYHFYNQLQSTNDKAFDIGDENNRVIVAYTQTNGRGRADKIWTSYTNDLLLSFVKKIDRDIDCEALSLKIGLRLTQFLGNHHTVKIKWPNDLYLYDKNDKEYHKIVGILIERKLLKNEQILVIGLGMNLSKQHKYYIEYNNICKNWQHFLIKISQIIAIEINSLIKQKKVQINPKEFQQWDYLSGKEIQFNNSQELPRKHNTQKIIANGINSKGELLISDEHAKIYALTNAFDITIVK